MARRRNCGAARRARHVGTLGGVTLTLATALTACGSNASVHQHAAAHNTPSEQASQASSLLTDLYQRALTANQLGTGYVLESSADTSRPAPPYPVRISPASPSCEDVTESFGGEAIAGRLAATRFVYRSLVDRSAGISVVEWIGTYSGSGAEQAITNFANDFGLCHAVTLTVPTPAERVTAVRVPAPRYGDQSMEIDYHLGRRETNPMWIARYGADLVSVTVSALGNRNTPILSQAVVAAATRFAG